MRGLAVILVLTMASCAGYSIKEGGTGDGYDVYQPEPYLLRTPIKQSDGNISGFTFDVKWLPNYSKRYRVTSWTGFGASNIAFTFEDGWKLTKLHDQSDNTKVLENLTGLTKHLIPANPFDIDVAQSGTGSERWDLIEESNQPVLYRIVFDNCGQICGLKRFRVMECAGTPATRVAPIQRTRSNNGGGDGNADPAAEGGKTGKGGTKRSRE